MKKIITFITVTITAMITFSGDFDLFEQVKQAQLDRKTNEVAQAFLDNLTDEQWLQYIDQYIATNAILHQANTNYYGNIHGITGLKNSETWLGWKLFGIGGRRGNIKALCDEYDQKIVNAGFAGFFPGDRLSTYFPKLHAYSATHTHINSANRHRAIYAVRMACRDTVNQWGMFRESNVPETINMLVNNKICGFTSIENTDTCLKKLTPNSIKTIKRKLREKGISFVVAEGESNPVQEAIDTLTAAFQAPKLTGVKEWVAEWYPEYQWIDLDDLFMSDEDIAQLCEDIYYGEKDLTDSTAQIILTHIGLDAYNEFIRRYNGDKNNL